MNIKYKAVIFDLDGTLADTQSDIADSTNRVLVSNNFPTHSYDDYKKMVGKGLIELIKQALPNTITNEHTVSSCLEMLISDYSQNCLVKTKLYDGVQILLNQLNKLNIPIAIFTNKDQKLAEIVCSELFKDTKIKFLLGKTDQFPRKPNPQGALYLAEKLNSLPNETLFIGDTENDMLCANNAGMASVGVLWGFRDKQTLINANAKHIVNKPSEIYNLITN